MKPISKLKLVFLSLVALPYLCVAQDNQDIIVSDAVGNPLPNYQTNAQDLSYKYTTAQLEKHVSVSRKIDCFYSDGDGSEYKFMSGLYTNKYVHSSYTTYPVNHIICHEDNGNLTVDVKANSVTS